VSAAPTGTPGAPSPQKTVRVAIAGATGYTGQELLRLLARHPGVSITAAMSSGTSGGSARPLPALARLWNGQIAPLSHDVLAHDADVVFLALPDKAAAELGPALADGGVRVIDLSGAFRLRDAAARARWYPETHRFPDSVVYGLTELARDAVAGVDIIVDAKSGASGAGKTPTERTHFSEVHGSLSAYGVFNHRHGAEIEQGVDGPVTFTPHLLPIDRGILETIYVRVAPGTTEEALADVYERAYGSAAFVRLVGSALPEIKHVVHTNFCDIGWRVDPSGRVILVSVIDNLVKGASGQAVQNLNVMLGLDERTALL